MPMFYTSGTQVDHELTINVCQFFTTKYAPIKKYDLEIYFSDLSEDGVKGWQEKNGDEFLIHIDYNLTADEHIRTLLHELIHCIQDIKGITDTQTREDEAYHLEEQYSNELKLVTSKVSL